MDGDIPICNISNTNTSKIILENPYLSKLRGSRQHKKYGNICCTRCREIISIVTLTFIHTIIGVMLSDKKERSAGFSTFLLSNTSVNFYRKFKIKQSSRIRSAQTLKKFIEILSIDKSTSNRNYVFRSVVNCWK